MADGVTGAAELQRFISDLQDLRERAGKPSFRAMSRTAHYSHTALAGVLSGGRLPSLTLTLAFVRACGGDEASWRGRWQRVSAAMAADGEVPDDPPPSSDRGPRWSWARIPPGRRRLALFAAGVAAAAAATVGTLMGTDMYPHAGLVVYNCPARHDPGDHPLVRCDDSRFIADVTIPDGTTVRANQTFVKTWEIQNSGLIPWRGRFLTRQGLLGGQGLCMSPAQVPVPYTAPGQDVDISVTLTAPNVPGSCRVDFKMTDANGILYFPGMGGGLYVIVNVTG
jgi:hypothetical protein